MQSDDSKYADIDKAGTAPDKESNVINMRFKRT